MTDGQFPDLHNRFMFHKATDRTGALHSEVRDRCYALAQSLVGLMPQGREASLAITKLEEVMMWANAAIARNPVDEPEV